MLRILAQIGKISNLRNLRGKTTEVSTGHRARVEGSTFRQILSLKPHIAGPVSHFFHF